jgi:hypothetical protein
VETTTSLDTELELVMLLLTERLVELVKETLTQKVTSA